MHKRLRESAHSRRARVPGRTTRPRLRALSVDPVPPNTSPTGFLVQPRLPARRSPELWKIAGAAPAMSQATGAAASANAYNRSSAIVRRSERRSRSFAGNAHPTSSASMFEFDCPKCRCRCRAPTAAGSDHTACTHCGTAFPTPHPPEPPGTQRSRARRTGCPACGRRLRTHAGVRPRSYVCGYCRCEFPVPIDESHEWSRPVARVFTRRDRSYSLHHLMMHTRRAIFPDRALSARARRRFEFYCGLCGCLQPARVWDIAAQVPCRACDALVIVPSPVHRPERVVAWSSLSEMPEPRPRMSASGSQSALTTDTDRATHTVSTLYCPQCGRPSPQTAPSRLHMSFCDVCNHWF